LPKIINAKTWTGQVICTLLELDRHCQKMSK